MKEFLIRCSPVITALFLNTIVVLYFLVHYSGLRTFVEISSSQSGELVVFCLIFFFMSVLNIGMFLITALALTVWWRRTRRGS